MGQCKICGKPTLGHLLYCRSCYAKLTAEKKTGESPQEKSVISPTPQADLAHPFAVPSKSHLVEPGHCIICGGPTTKGNHFCLDCYRKYARKVVFIKVAECSKFEVLEDSWEGNYTCKDGHAECAVQRPHCEGMVLIDPECLDCSRPCCGKSFSPQEVREKVKLSPPKKRWLKEAKGYRNKQKELLSLYWTITVLGFLVGFLTFFFLSFGLF